MLQPTLLPPNRREAAQAAPPATRTAIAVSHVRMHAWRLLGDFLEACRTAGIVLSILLFTDLHQAPVWGCMLLLFAPTLWDVLAMVVALVRRR